jgi:hypothetical protein
LIASSISRRITAAVAGVFESVITHCDCTPPNTRRPSSPDLHVILEEEWEHHRYAVRDLDAIAAKSGE